MFDAIHSLLGMCSVQSEQRQIELADEEKFCAAKFELISRKQAKPSAPIYSICCGCSAT